MKIRNTVIAMITTVMLFLMLAEPTTAQTGEEIRAAQAAEAQANRIKLERELDEASTQAEAHPGRTFTSRFTAETASSDSGGSGGSDRPQPMDLRTVPDYQVIDLGVLETQPDGFSIAFAINNNGQVVGRSSDDVNGSRAFLYSDGSMRNLRSLLGDGGTSTAFGINSLGQVVGISDSASGQRAFLYSNGTMQNLGSSITIAKGINSSGKIVGLEFLYSEGIVKDLGTLGGSYSFDQSINDNNQVVGYSATVTGQIHPFLYDGGMQDLNATATNDGYAYAINNNGQVAGFWFTNSGGSVLYSAFLYSNSTMKNIGSGVAWAINNYGQVVGESSNRAILYMNNSAYDLNNLTINNGSGWQLLSARGINDRGQIVGQGINPSGKERAFLLNPLPYWQEIKDPPSQPIYGSCPMDDPTKTKLVFITHGAIPPYENNPENSVAWIDSMSNSIAIHLAQTGQTDWQIMTYRWIGGAQVTYEDIIRLKGIRPAFQAALKRGELEGSNLGHCSSLRGWSHVHFISHSAGAGLIEALAEIVRPVTGAIHCTFLDPFVGTDYAGRINYGKVADWSENYFAHDLQTGSTILPYTDGVLDHCYNVNVTYLDSLRVSLGLYLSDIAIEQCTVTISSHAWPVNFYQGTIPTNTMPLYEGMGFPNSLEGGNWVYATNHYAVGNNPARALGTPDGCHGPLTTAVSYVSQLYDFVQASVVGQSVTGTLEKWVGSLGLHPGSPVWISTLVTPTNAVNFVLFDAKFIGTNGSAGLLSTYWDDQMIGQVDERVVQPEFQHYTFAFPFSFGNGSHVLGFRLDPFNTNALSSAIVTNVLFGLSGVSEPFSLSVTTNMSAELRVFQLTGQSNFTYTVEASPNLVDWIPIAELANTNGTVRFVDIESTNYAQRYYRAVAPY